MRRTAYSIGLCACVALAYQAGAWQAGKADVEAAPDGRRRVRYYVDPMHPSYTSDKPGRAPDCGMPLEPVYDDDRRAEGVVTVSADQERLAGIQVATVAPRGGSRRLRLVGHAQADETRVFAVRAGIEGYVRTVAPIATGTAVARGAVLATFSAPDAISAIQAYIVALNAMDTLRANGGVDAADALATSANYEQRIERLHNVGVSSAQIEEIARTRVVPERIRVIAPAAGLVIARGLSEGQTFERGAEWFRIADLRRMWAVADVSASDAADIRRGSTATVRIPNHGGVLRARVSGAVPAVDPATRGVRLRLDVENPDLLLRPDMIVEIGVEAGASPALLVPIEAVRDTGLRQVVFVERERGMFQPRGVQVGARRDGRAEIVAGLRAGERIAVAGTFLLDSETRMRSDAGDADAAAADPLCRSDAKAAANLVQR